MKKKWWKKLVKSKPVISLVDKGLIPINEYINTKLNRLQYENDNNAPPKNFKRNNYFIQIDGTINLNNILKDLTKYEANEFYQYTNEQNLINYNREKCIYYLVYDHIDDTSMNIIVKLSNYEKPLRYTTQKGNVYVEYFPIFVVFSSKELSKVCNGNEVFINYIKNNLEVKPLNNIENKK